MKLTASTPSEQRRQALLLGALVVVAAVVWYTIYSPRGTVAAPPGTPAVAATSTETRDGRVQTAASGLPEPVRFADLEPVPDQSSAARNPFGFGTRPAPPAPRVPVRPPAPPAPPPAPAVPALPPIPVKFLGFIEDPARPGKIVALGVNGGVLVAREGDLVDGRYRLVKIGLESIVMAYPDGRGQRTIRLSGS